MPTTLLLAPPPPDFKTLRHLCHVLCIDRMMQLRMMLTICFLDECAAIFLETACLDSWRLCYQKQCRILLAS